MERVINYGKLLQQSAGANAQQKWCFNSPVGQILVAMSQQTGCRNHTLPLLPTHPRSEPIPGRTPPPPRSHCSTLASCKTHSNLWQLFTFLSGKLVGEGAARRSRLGAIRVNKQTNERGMHGNRPREMSLSWDGPGKQGFAGPCSGSPSSSHSHHFIPGLPAVCRPRNSGLCSPLPSAPPTHNVGFSLPQ